jgi:hypothetical protein
MFRFGKPDHEYPLRRAELGIIVRRILSAVNAATHEWVRYPAMYSLMVLPLSLSLVGRCSITRRYRLPLPFLACLC